MENGGCALRDEADERQLGGAGDGDVVMVRKEMNSLKIGSMGKMEGGRGGGKKQDTEAE